MIIVESRRLIRLRYKSKCPFQSGLSCISTFILSKGLEQQQQQNVTIEPKLPHSLTVYPKDVATKRNNL